MYAFNWCFYFQICWGINFLCTSIGALVLLHFHYVADLVKVRNSPPHCIRIWNTGLRTNSSWSSTIRPRCTYLVNSLLKSINFIFQGEEFVGLIPLVKQYLASLDCDADTACTVHQYLKLISYRAKGTALTNASWIRKFVLEHPLYKYVMHVVLFSISLFSSTIA